MTAQPAIAELDAPARRSLLGLTRDELRDVVAAHGGKPFHAKVLFHWLYSRGATAFEDMTSLPKGLRAALADGWTAERPVKAQDLASEDGTHKWLLRFADGNEAESVHIPDGERGTLCVSSQVGCTLNCRFCHTGTQRLVRNLGAGEIVAQVMVARDHFGEWPAPAEDRQLTNIVLMGMGEPLYNYDNVAKAMRIVMDPEGLALGKRRITLSTAGVVPTIRRCGEELGVNLAISLHAVTDALRDEIVPLNRKYPIAELLDACRNYPTLNNARRITFEYVMLDGVNDSPADARELARLVRDIPAKINLIPFNPWPGAPYACSSDAAIARFAGILADHHLTAPVRTPRGRDIMAACGQLKSESQKIRAGARA